MISRFRDNPTDLMVGAGGRVIRSGSPQQGATLPNGSTTGAGVHIFVSQPDVWHIKNTDATGFGNGGGGMLITPQGYGYLYEGSTVKGSKGAPGAVFIYWRGR